jgi:SAM-dependent methyltransferase
MLNALSDRGWDALGTELSEESSTFAREELGLEVKTGPFEVRTFDAKSFDVVVLWHVFEHMSAPALVLKKIHGILKEDGLLIISVPNFGSLQSKLSRDKWFHLDLPRHLYHFTPSTLEFILKENGFRIIRRKHTSLEYSYFGMIQSLFNVLGIRVNYLYDLIRRRDARLGGDEGFLSWSFVLTVLFAPFIFPLAVVLTFFVDVSSLGGNIEVHAVRSDF